MVSKVAHDSKATEKLTLLISKKTKEMKEEDVSVVSKGRKKKSKKGETSRDKEPFPITHTKKRSAPYDSYNQKKTVVKAKSIYSKEVTHNVVTPTHKDKRAKTKRPKLTLKEYSNNSSSLMHENMRAKKRLRPHK